MGENVTNYQKMVENATNSRKCYNLTRAALHVGSHPRRVASPESLPMIDVDGLRNGGSMLTRLTDSGKLCVVAIPSPSAVQLETTT